MLMLEPRDKFDKCVIGISYTDNCAVYDVDLVIETFMEINDWDYETAIEWFGYNTLRSFNTDDSPIFISKDFELED